MKKCIDCGKIKPIEEFVKDKNKKDGVRNRCKECENARRRKTPSKLKPKPKEGFKYCAMCGLELPLEDFSLRYILGKYRPHSYCKTCDREKDSNKYKHVCEKCGKEYRSGRKNGKLCSDCYHSIVGKQGAKHLIKYMKIPEHNPWYGKQRFGKDNPNYNPDKTDEEREKGRNIEGYTIWVDSVYKRDNYTCQCCGDNKGGNLVAHHKDGYHWCKERRLDISNGVTLCNKYHKQFHATYGYNNNTEEQFNEFINNMLIPR